MTKILVVDDEQSIREMLEIYLQREGYDVTCVSNGEAALSHCMRTHYDVVITDIKMPKMDGISLLNKVKEMDPETVFIMITAFASFETAKESMDENAYDYITKPFNVEEIKRKIETSLSKTHQHAEKKPKNPVMGAGQEPLQFKMLGKSKQIRKVFDLIPRAASAKSNVLIQGESGTGKELVARAIHDHSERKNKPFMTINCGGIPENLLESELFGYRKGAFTGALKDKQGFLDAAHGGTLFLDEVGELPLSLQVKLLRMVQDKTYTPIGGTREVAVDVRIISATNKNLEKMVMEGSFREDLYYRLNVISIPLPPLRDRKEDIPLLAKHFFRQYSREMDKDVTEISSYALECLMNYQFPGNVRELENIIERSVSLSQTSIMLPDSLELSRFKSSGLQAQDRKDSVSISPDGISLDAMLEACEKKYIEEALRMSHGSIKGAARLLGLTFRSMRYRLEKLNMDVQPYKNNV